MFSCIRGTNHRLQLNMPQAYVSAADALDVKIRMLCTIMFLIMHQGYDVAAHVLSCFGGAGGQHACAIARSLGMSTIFMHRYAGAGCPGPGNHQVLMLCLNACA